ncbi:MAG: LAGLIDADG family homing endonuclease [Nanoarchaeota archaeon]
MRIKLASGKQKELIFLAKGDKTWAELSSQLKVPSHYLSNDLKSERILLSDKLYFSLCDLAGKSFDNFILEKLEDTWGKSKGGKNSSGTYLKDIKLPNESIGLAELFGIMLGDGNLTSIKDYKIGTYQIRIVGDSRYDRDYLENYVKPLIEKLFDVRVSTFKAKGENAFYLVATGRKLVEFFIRKGFKPGDKIRNLLDIPLWIRRDNEFLRFCLRGLYDTDGSAYKLTNQNSYQILFTNYNPVLLNAVRDSLLSLEIGVSKISRGRDITITKKSELRKFLKEVGFSNNKHLDKVKMWNISPIV